MFTPTPVERVRAVNLTIAPTAQAPGHITQILLMAGVFCSPMSTWNLVKGLLSYSDAFFLLALFSSFRVAALNLRNASTPPLFFVAAAILAISGAMTYLLHDANPINAAKLIFSMAFVPLLVARVVDDNMEKINAVLCVWLAGTLLSSAVALSSSYGIALFGLYDPLAATGQRAAGLGYHPNILGLTSVLGLFVSFYLLGVATTAGARSLLVASALLLAYGLYASGSRASLVAFLAALLPWLWRPHQWLRLLVLCLGLTVMVVTSVTLVIETDVKLPDQFLESPIGRLLGLASSAAISNTERSEYINVALAQFFDAPFFGVGYDNLRGAHIHILSILHSGGVLGLSALIAWTAALFLPYYRVNTWLPNEPDTRLRRLFLLCTSGMLITLVNGGLQPILHERNGYILIGVLLALDTYVSRHLHATQGTYRNVSILHSTARAARSIH